MASGGGDNNSQAWKFPRHREYLRYSWSKNGNSFPPRHLFYDTKFYPYGNSSVEAPVLALLGNREIILCRPAIHEEGKIKVINVFRDLEPVFDVQPNIASTVLNSCAWNYIDQSQPLLSVAGSSGLIKVLNALSGQLMATLVGHGSDINDLATHPKYPWILASASGDHSIRVWDLRRNGRDGKYPCLIICGHGQGHREAVLTCAWHQSGRYLISGGQDHMVCIWTVPDLGPNSSFYDEQDARLDNLSGSKDVVVIYYPHFTTSMIHHNYVDCVSFYGNLILSKAAEEDKVVLWMVTGFDGDDTPPSSDSAPTIEMSEDTRSGFLHSSPQEAANQRFNRRQTPLFTRLLQFQLSSSELFYMRFSLLLPSARYPNLHPMLAVGNTKGKVYFWDLIALAKGTDDGVAKSGKPKERDDQRERGREQLMFSTAQAKCENMAYPQSATSRQTSTSRGSSMHATTTETSRSSVRRSTSQGKSTAATSPFLPAQPDISESHGSHSAIGDPFTPVPAHYSHTPKTKYPFLIRQAAWSPCGRWCVFAGESGSQDAMAVVYDRSI